MNAGALKIQAIPHKAIAVVLLLALAPSAKAFWNISARRNLREADERMEQGRQAEEEQRILEACEAYSQAYELYQMIQRDSPGTKPEHVLRQSAECRARIRTLFARAGSGPTAAPPPDEILPILAGDRRPPAGSARPPIADADDAAPPTEGDALENPEPVEPAPERTWLGRLFFGQPASTAPAAAPAEPATPPRSAPGQAPLPLPALPAVAPPAAMPSAAGRNPASDRALFETTQAMLERGEGAEAVLHLEEIVEAAGPNATFVQRLLLAQALLNRRNYDRARELLDTLLAEEPGNPSVKTLAAGVHLAQGRPIAALRLMDELVREYPRFADAYVNLAYVRFAMNPAENRDEAIVYYRHALTLGAARDPRLELELRVDVNP
jgi:tetratricopeptide (TPR) repeat protein